MALSPRTLDTLRRVNWTEQYICVLEPIETRLRALGHVVTPAARDFLSRFGGLHCYQQSSYQPGTHLWHTDAVEAASRIDREDVRQHETEIGAALTPIGQAAYGYWVLLMDEQGGVFASDEQLRLREVASSGEELFETMTCTELTEPAWGSPRHVRDWRARWRGE